MKVVLVLVPMVARAVMSLARFFSSWCHFHVFSSSIENSAKGRERNLRYFESVSIFASPLRLSQQTFQLSSQSRFQSLLFEAWALGAFDAFALWARLFNNPHAHPGFLWIQRHFHRIQPCKATSFIYLDRNVSHSLQIKSKFWESSTSRTWYRRHFVTIKRKQQSLEIFQLTSHSRAVWSGAKIRL